MRFSSTMVSLGLLLTGVSALDKPLDIQIEKAVECSRKTVTGMRPQAHSTRIELIDTSQATK